MAGGGHNTLGSALPGSFKPFAPEFVTEYEIGAKLDLLNHRLRNNLVLYYSDYTDIQRAIIAPVDGGVASITANAAAGTVRGAELETTAILTDRLRLQTAIAYTDAQYDDYQGCSATDPTCLSQPSQNGRSADLLPMPCRPGSAQCSSLSTPIISHRWTSSRTTAPQLPDLWGFRTATP